MIDSRIIYGLVTVLIAIGVLAYAGIQEPDRMALAASSQKAKSIQTGAIIFEENCSPCHNTNGTGIPGAAPALNSEHFFTERLKEVGYQGTLESYIALTVAGGRPVKSTTDYVQPMPTWSQDYGGPLRDDQIKDVVNFVLNWQFEERGETAAAAASDDPVVRGQALFNSAGCSACHAVQGVSSAEVGPELTNVFAEKGADYIHESIVNPDAVIVEGYADNVMPEIFANLFSDQDLDDIIAFLENAGQ